MIMRSSLTRLAAVIGAFGMLLAEAGPAHAEKLRIAGNFPTNHTSTVAMKGFAEDVSKATNGELTIDVFPAMQLGGPQENVDQVLSGTIALTWLGTGYLTKHVPALEAVNVPFLFKDRATAFRVVDGAVGEEFKKLLVAKNLVPLGYMELGFRNVTNNVRPIKRLEDFKGLKLRSVPSETHLATFRALGANALPMDWKEVYSALQQGVMDGQENPWPIILDARLFEVQKFVSNTRHLYDFIIVVANKRVYDGLKPAHRTAFDAAMKKAVAFQRTAAQEADDKALAQLTANKMQYDEIPDAELRRIRDAVAGVVDSVRKRAGDKVMDLILSESRKS
jgi:tripartite ATP-independent transporter DctP family solute receptor